MEQEMKLTSISREDGGHKALRLEYSMRGGAQDKFERISYSVILANENWNLLHAQEVAFLEAIRQLQSQLAVIQTARANAGS